MKATLIFPGIILTGWNTFGKVPYSEANFVSYGIAYISAYAKKQGHLVDLIDLRKLNGWDDFEWEVKKRSPGVFGISSTSLDWPVTLEAIKRIKSIHNDSVIVLGGVHATTATKEAKEIETIDYIIRGEGEIAFSQLLSNIEKRRGSKERIIQGISPDINTTPYPDRDSFDYEKGESLHPWLSHMKAPFASITTSRGCPFRCSFCQPAERMVFGGARIRTVEGVIKELKFLREKYKFRSLLIHDDLFTFNKKWVLEFCEKYRSEGLAQDFVCQARVDFIVKNEDVIEKMVQSGLTCLMIGFESGSQRILDFLKKGTTVEQNWKAAEICKKYNIRIFANYMIGVPTETPDEVIQTVRFIQSIKPHYPSPAYFTPYPGTDLYNYCLTNDLILGNSYGYYNRAAGSSAKIRNINYDFLEFAAERSRNYKYNKRLEERFAPRRIVERSRSCIDRLKKVSEKGILEAFSRSLYFVLRRKLLKFWYHIRYGFYISHSSGT